jgi:hypothetical protein
MSAPATRSAGFAGAMAYRTGRLMALGFRAMAAHNP